MSSQQIKEVNDAKEKWNKEGTPEESQANYHKNNLKKTLEDFSEQLCCTMGCHVVLLVSHKKRADQTLSVTLHESQSQNVKKNFSVSSNGIKEWALTGFEFFTEWSKVELYPNGEDDEVKEEEDDNGLPEVVLDDEGYAKLPSHDDIKLKGQQELVQTIFLASYKAFTHSCKLVPWSTITASESEYLATGSVPENFVVCDPSHMRMNEINSLWSHWQRWSNVKKRLVTFIKARRSDMRTDLREDTGDKRSLKKKKPYEEVCDIDGFSGVLTQLKDNGTGEESIQ
ncbi:uncharacterized protein HD556DRAFT_1476917 [Suillus plorans]|uniref:Uncharacterized protein n=1 Tax=Suillus plorans TaxID=116603 RepID=A0A9P7DHZ8_9AGAM|nr:uncharacterized protein HD556DRAFT_1476917 [Suillus plorans]KAG1793639.1 hypothetical protein HD556DRAFT_1476917 [Suillus plorans]